MCGDKAKYWRNATFFIANPRGDVRLKPPYCNAQVRDTRQSKIPNLVDPTKQAYALEIQSGLRKLSRQIKRDRRPDRFRRKK